MARLTDGLGSSARSSLPWHVGETRTLFTEKMQRPLTITRTSRSFAEDWADAANEADHEQLSAKGLRWVAHPDGYTQLRSVRHMIEAERKRIAPPRQAVPHWQDREPEPA